jgi:hypothetical protein
MKTYKEILSEAKILVAIGKALKKNKNDDILVQDNDGNEWSISLADFDDHDGKTIFATDSDGGEKELNIKNISKVV